MILQKSGTAAMLYNLRRGAATVNVENVCAHFFSHLRGHSHSLWLATKDLNSERTFIFIKPHLPFRLGVTTCESLNRYEFGYREADPTAPLQQATKRHVGDAGHW